MNDFRIAYTKQYLSSLRELLQNNEDVLARNMDQFTDILYEARKTRNTIFIMGNGGSAATASHFAGDLLKGTIVEGLPRFKAVALTDNTPIMLAWGNDDCYENIFSEQLINLMEKGDVVIGISGSGSSKNVLRAIDYANKNGATTVGISGFDGGGLIKSAHFNIHVKSTNMQHVEDVHMIIVHLLTSLIRNEGKKQ
ncbi:MAG: SIS domain-containing protein [Spirochaetes bacterium]|nr:SIS domain-containing protein [Spirochaetota bacterium]